MFCPMKWNEINNYLIYIDTTKGLHSPEPMDRINYSNISYRYG